MKSPYFIFLHKIFRLSRLVEFNENQSKNCSQKAVQIRHYIYPIFIFTVYLLGSCQNHQEPEDINTEEIPKDFSEFYVLFHTDSVYQMEHILFPLEGRPAKDTSQFDDEFKWQKDSWKIHNFDHFDQNLYEVSRKVTDSTLITEVIRDKQSGFGIKRRFARFNDKWYLIYYDAMNPTP